MRALSPLDWNSAVRVTRRVDARRLASPNACIASRTEWERAGIAGATVTAMVIRGLIERDAAGNLYHEGIIAKLDPLFAAYATERKAGERFSDFVIRAGFVVQTGNGADFHADTGDRRRN
jgi:sulfite reductase beta subunit-like hemoprotein